MKRLQSVIWTKGTFLTPQHLQIQDRFLEDALQFRLDALKFCAWGFTELVIDQQKLATGNFSVAHASGIFPDGLSFDIPDSDPAPPSKSLTELFEPGATSMDVYLTVPDYRQRGLNVAINQRDAATRYIAEVATFRDENTGVGEKPVQLARKNMRFITEVENREGNCVLPIAKIEKAEGNTFRLGSRFVPPLLNIHAHEYVTGLLRGIIEVLAARSGQLSGTRRQKNQSLADFTSADIANFWLLYTINSWFPLFSHFLDAKQVHPEELYSALVSLAGSLTTFSAKLRPRDLPSYDHDNLGTVLSNLDEKLRSLLQTVVPTNLVSLPLRLVQPSIYATALADDKYLTDTKMYLAVSSELAENAVIQKVPQTVKVCSATHIDHLIKQALPGIELRHQSNPPSSIPVKLKYQYFTLNQSGPAWEAVVRARNFAAYVPSDLPNPQLELLILLPQTS